MLISKQLTLSLLLTLGAPVAHAQTTTSTCWRDSVGTVTCQNSPSAPGRTPGQYGYLHDAGKDGFEAAGRQLEQMLSSNKQQQNVHAVGIVLAVRCGHKAEFAMVSYSDGSTKRVTIDSEITADDRINIAATLPQVRIVDLAGCGE
jgi:hypothetical protein